ncbi:hypothetical protein J4459_04105 [Candidatus Woesearchaeota archaeon]|nr:hypothetical protein [Candidatus Woesearchaeota archaeon]
MIRILSIIEKKVALEAIAKMGIRPVMKGRDYSEEVINFLSRYELIENKEKDENIYELTEKGEEFYDSIFNRFHEKYN